MTYTYTLETTRPFFPRHIADMLTERNLSRALVSVTDCQNDSHVYGATYQVRELHETATTPLRYEELFSQIQQCYNEATGTPERDACQWMLNLLHQEWVEGNYGLLCAYLKEFQIALQGFEALLERQAQFGKE